MLLPDGRSISQGGQTGSRQFFWVRRTASPNCRAAAMIDLATIRTLTTGTAMCSRQERFCGARRVGQNVAPALVRGIA